MIEVHKQFKYKTTELLRRESEIHLKLFPLEPFTEVLAKLQYLMNDEAGLNELMQLLKINGKIK